LVTAVKLLAPVIPFAAEEMYQHLVRDHSGEAPVSVHLTGFPEPGRIEIDENLLEAMDRLQEVVEQGHAARQQASLKVRQPVASVRVAGLGARMIERLGPLLPLLEDELNVKRVELGVPEDSLYRLAPRLDRKIAGPLFKGLLPEVQAALEREPAERVAAAVESGEDFHLEVGGQAMRVPAEGVVLEKHPRDGWELAEGNGFVVAVDTRLTDELLEEGLARDLVRRVQDLRKELDFEIGDRIRITYQAADRVVRLFQNYREYITQETLATEIQLTQAPPPDASEVSIGDDRLVLRLDRIG
jgi:isoleucyl-tRNA synthetase